MNLDNANFATFVDVDKVVEILEGDFTYSYTESDSGGYFSRSNPQPGELFLPFTIYSIDGGVTFFGDLDGIFGSIPDFLTCARPHDILYRWGAYGPGGSINVLYKTALLAREL